MKKSCVIFFNCHGNEIRNHLLMSNQFNNNYTIHLIALYHYIEGYKYEKNTDLIEEHKNLVQTCDLIILQYIKKKNRNVIHHDYIKSLLKSDCISIIIPHYSFSGYQYPYDIFNDDNIIENITKEDLQNYVNQLFIDKKNEILIHLENELNHIKELDRFSDVSCYEFIKKNYNKKLLFYSRSYPTYILFHFITQKILEKIKINDIIKTKWSAYAKHCSDIIFPNVKKYLNIQFDIDFNYNCNILEYIICCKKYKINSLLLKETKKGKYHSKFIKELILSKKYR